MGSDYEGRRPLTRDELAAELHRIADSVAAGDSFEGSIDYTCMLEELPPGEFQLRGAVRIGNRDGQGGMRLYERASPPPQAEPPEQSVRTWEVEFKPSAAPVQAEEPRDDKGGTE